MQTKIINIMLLTLSAALGTLLFVSPSRSSLSAMQDVGGVAVYEGRKVLSTDDTGTSYAAVAATLTQPTDYFSPVSNSIQGTLLPFNRNFGARGFALYPMGGDDDDDTFRFRLYGWKTFWVSAGVVEYVPFTLWEGEATLSTIVGVSGGFGTSVRWADTLTAVTAVATAYDAFTGLTANIHSPGSNGSRAWVAFEDGTQQFDFFTVDCDLDAGGGTDAESANVIVKFIQ